MEQHVIRDRLGLWIGGVVLLLGVILGVHMRYAGWFATVFIIVCAVFVSTVLIYDGTRITTFSKTGICEKTLFRTINVSWDQIDKASVAWLHLGKSAQWYISLSWPGNPEKKHWVYRWLWFMKLENKDGFLFPYSDELRDLVIKHYGPLDYNGMEDTQEI